MLPTRRSVYVVDDDPSMRKGVMRLLREHGFNVELFESGNALLSQGDCGEAFCIILDIQLNDVSGIDVRRRLTEMGVAAPVIYITGNDSAVNRSAAIASGCIAYLTKPFAAQSLIEPVERASEGIA
jgi:FixJ family two-component response regulator